MIVCHALSIGVDGDVLVVTPVSTDTAVSEVRAVDSVLYIGVRVSRRREVPGAVSALFTQVV